MPIDLVCPTCGTPVDTSSVAHPSVVHCEICTEKLVWADEALTYVDEMPHDEYLGG